MRFLHCSDVHVTQDYRAAPFLKLGWRRWIAMAEISVGGRGDAYAKARETLKQIATDADRHQVDHLIVSGDLTAYATEWEFKHAKEALSPRADDKQRCTVIPGNHDTYTPGAVASGRFERYFGHLIESDLPEYRSEGAFPFVRLLGKEAAVVGMLSARVPLMPGFSFGYLGKPQLASLKQIVADPRLAGRAVIVVVHHAPLAMTGKKDTLMHGLKDGDALFAAIPGPRFAVLHGHIHHRYHHAASETRPHTFGAGSSTQRNREGYWIIEVKDGLIVGGTMHKPGDPVDVNRQALAAMDAPARADSGARPVGL